MPVANASLRKRLAQVAIIGSLGGIALATPAQADLASCYALCQSQEAYCAAASGTIGGSCAYDYTRNVCTLPGCWLP
jgi:hypothetical protein